MLKIVATFRRVSHLLRRNPGSDLRRGFAQSGRQPEELAVPRRESKKVSEIGVPESSFREVEAVATGVPKLTQDPTEAELIERVCHGDKEAFYALVQPCERAVYTAAISILNNPADAEEVAQEAVLKAFAALPRFRGESKFSTWLIQITINEARLKLRKDRRHLYESIDEPKTDDEGDYYPKDFADWREIPSETLQRRELREALKRALD